MMSRTVKSLAVVLIVTALACSGAVTQTRIGPAPAFDLPDLAGGKVSLASLQGKVVVLDFWATWCGPCIRELPEIKDLTERWKARKDVVFLSFNATEEKPDVLAFVRERAIAYPVFMADDLVGPYEVNAFPTKLVIDMRGGGDGMVRFRRDGYTPMPSVEARVQELLDEGAPASR